MTISLVKKIPEGLYVQLSGFITLQTLKAHINKVLCAIEFEKEMGILWDASKVTDFDLTSQDMELIGEYLKKIFNKRGAGKSAWLLSDNIHLGMAQMFTELNKKSLPIELCAFHDHDAALQWLSS